MSQFSLPYVGAERAALSSARQRLPSFSGAKLVSAIPHRERWHRDALIALSLDPSIEAIEAAEHVVNDKGVLFSLRVRHRIGGWATVEFVADEEDRRWRKSDGGTVTLSRETVLRSPAVEARRAIWAARAAIVSVADRWQVMTALSASTQGLPLAEVVGTISSRSRDAVEAICALACEAVIHIDVARGLVPEARVTRA